MKELKILLEDNSGLLIAWEKNPVANRYNILGKDDTFNDSIIATTTENSIFLDKEKLNNVVAVSVESIRDDFQKDLVVEKTTTYIRKNRAYKILPVKCINSIRGITFSYATSTIYDKYFIYEKVGDKYKKIIETVDFQITSKKFKVGSTYYIEGYIKDEEGNIYLDSKSLDYECKPEVYTPSKEKPKISIIIPVYNCERYIPRAIDSLVLSTLKDIEVIIINDGSTDNTLKVLEAYKSKYPTLLKIDSKENGGQAKARYYGLGYAKAEYTYFMDADDFVHPNMLENMYNCAKETDADFVMNKIIVRENLDKTNIFFKCIDDKTNEKRYIVKSYEEFIMNKHNNSMEDFYLIALWQHIGRTKIYKEHVMPTFNNYEDMAYLRTIFSFGNKFAFQMDSYYVWDRRFNEIGRTSSARASDNSTPEEHVQTYLAAIFYFICDYNPDRIYYLYYDALCDLKEYFEPTINAILDQGFKYNRDNMYMEFGYKYISAIDVLSNPLLIQDKVLYRLVKGVLDTMKKALKEDK